jgi:hypothetical protein
VHPVVSPREDVLSIAIHLSSLKIMNMRRKSGALFLTVAVLAPSSALAEISNERALLFAANRARTCYVEMTNGRIKCGGRPQRKLAEASELLTLGTLVKGDEPNICNARTPVWLFKWRAFPTQAPIAVDATTGRVIECRN